MVIIKIQYMDCVERVELMELVERPEKVEISTLIS